MFFSVIGFLLPLVFDAITLSVFSIVWWRQHEMIRDSTEELKGVNVSFNVTVTLMIVLVFLNLLADLTLIDTDLRYFFYTMIRRIVLLVVAILGYKFYAGNKFETFITIYENTTGLIFNIFKKIRQWH